MPGNRENEVKRDREARSEERRAQHLRSARAGIMLAAARTVVRGGYQATTMRTIAKEAGYTASSLYTYFKSKEEIFAAIRDELLAHLDEVLTEPMPEGIDFDARVRILGHRFARFTEDFQEVIALHIVGGVEIPDEDAAGRFARVGQLQTACAAWFEANATPEELGGHPPSEISGLFLGILKGFMEQAFVAAHGSPEPVTLREYQARGLEYFFAALKAPPRD